MWFRSGAALLVMAGSGMFTDAQAWGQGPVTNAFTYQGELREGGSPASGLFDMQFRLHDALTVGAPVGSAVCLDNVSVINGRFTVSLDFGAQFNGQRRYLELQVRQDTGLDCSSAVGFTLLSPRQELAGVPYAMYALGASGNGVTNLNAANITTGSMAVTRMPTSGFWNLNSSLMIDSSTFMVDPIANRVGMGTEAPAAGLHVIRSWDGEDGALRVEGDKATLRFSSGLAGGNQSWMLHVGGDGPGNFGLYNRIAPSAWLNIMSITPSSRLGIGTTAPGARLHVANGDILAGETGEEWIFHTRTGSGGDFLHITDLEGGVAQFGRGLVINESGNIGIGTTAPFNRLHVVGTIEGEASIGVGVVGSTTSTLGSGRGLSGFALANTGTAIGVRGQSNSASGFDFYAGGAGMNYGADSSRRWKHNVELIADPLSKIERMRGVYFDWDAEHGGQHDVGMIAEEVGAVLPEIVQYEANGIDAQGMDYSKMAPLLVEAVKALRAEKDAEVERLTAENQSLKEGLRALERRLARLEAAR